MIKEDLKVMSISEVKFDSKKGLFVFIDLKNYLESLLKCKVDLVTKDALKKKILKEAKYIF